MSDKSSNLIKSASCDVSFCASHCENRNCSRWMGGKLWQTVIKSQASVCDYSQICSEYQRGGGKMRMPKNVKAVSQKEHKTIHQGEKIQTIVDLPADLQDVYNVLHLTEKQFEVLDNFLEKALVALMRQPKYEKIIAEMAEEIASYAGAGAGVYCAGCKYFECENEICYTTEVTECRAHIGKYYKQRAGLGGEECRDAEATSKKSLPAEPPDMTILEWLHIGRKKFPSAYLAIQREGCPGDYGLIDNKKKGLLCTPGCGQCGQCWHDAMEGEKR